MWASDVLHAAEAQNCALGHENRGFLSRSAGFMPARPPRATLPDTHALWDEIAADLPRLHRTLRLRRALETMPLLPADTGALDDDALLRAAALLGFFAHSYQYVETTSPGRLPEAIARPWRETRRRLGRDAAVLTYIDLIVYNFVLVDPAAADPHRVENMALLVSTMDTPEERRFYLTQTEILAVLGRAAAAMADAQDAAREGRQPELGAALTDVLTRLERATHRSLRKIDPRSSSRYHVDPVRWAKCVAPFAVPFEPGIQGPSGTSSPIFNALDIFLGRERFESALGREIQALRRGYPPHWCDFLEALGRLSVPRWIAEHGGRELRALLDEVRRAYAGRGGFLDRHRMKVYGYLELAFKLGRGVTIGGFRGAFGDRTWNRVDEELVQSAAERPAPAAAAPTPPLATHDRRGRRIAASEIARHNGPPDGYWLLVNGTVYDVTSFLPRHPGGAHTLMLHAGTDATAAFRRAHGGHERALASLAQHAIGWSAVADDPHAAGWIGLLFLLAEMENALRADQRLQTLPCSSGERASPRSAWRLQRAIETHQRFATSYVGMLLREPSLAPAAQGIPDVAAGASALTARLAAALRRIVAATSDDRALLPIATACGDLEAADARLLADLKASALQAVQLLEGGSPAAVASDRLRLAAAASVQRIRAWMEEVAAP